MDSIDSTRLCMKKDLAAARKFKLDRRTDHAFRELDDLRVDREPVARRRFDHGHITHTEKRHIQRSWDGRRRERKHIDLLLKLLELFLVADAETLFFVDDDKAEFWEFDVRGQDPMRADQDVDLAACGKFDRPFLLFRGAKTREQLDLDRERGEPLLERLKMLIREYGRRR